MNSIYLFCGGNKHYPNKKSKPLQKFGGKSELIISHLDHIKNYFDKISYLVEKDEVPIFSKLLKKVVKNPRIIEVKNSSSTIEKLKESMKHMKEEYACVSYPDIFCDSNFWEISKLNNFTVSRVSISSRFPRIYSDIFTDIVKGVSKINSDNFSKETNPLTTLFLLLILILSDLFADKIKSEIADQLL